jgi:hypothetical protein
MNDDLGAQLRRLATWADRVPPEHRRHVSARIDQLARLLGELVGADPERTDT